MMKECVSQAGLGRDVDERVQALRALLAESVACMRRGNLSRVVELGEQANAIVDQMKQRGDNLPAVLGAQRPELQRLYEELASMLRAEQADVHARLKHLRRVRRAVGAYRTDH